MTDTRQTWTFAEDEGGTTAITYDSAEATVDVTSGPDCDGTTTNTEYAFHDIESAPAGYVTGVMYRNPAWRNRTVYDLYAADPDTAAFDWARDELGHALLTGKYPLTAPERS